ncbi:TBC1D22B, partial [Cordylochernes scorpioides]
MLTKGVRFHQDNARPHAARQTTALIEEFGWELVSHPPCCPDVATSDFHLFPELKKKTWDDDELEEAVLGFLRGQAAEFFDCGLHEWVSRMQKCVERNGGICRKMKKSLIITKMYSTGQINLFFCKKNICGTYLTDNPHQDVEDFEVSSLPEAMLQGIEADSYWCLANLLDSIQDQYTFSQPGIQSKVKLLQELIQRIDAPLHEHLKRHSVEYLQFSFRWMNNLLMRELPLKCTIRLWDTYLAEVNGFSTFHLYVCAAFLSHWSQDLLNEKDFQGLMMLLQNLPTLHWGDGEISLLVAEAYSLKFMFADAPNHLQHSGI